MNGSKPTIRIELNNELLEKYSAWYFARYPKRRKLPIKRPLHESLNTWMILPRPAMNALKQNWKEFIVWTVREMGLENRQLEHAAVSVCSYMPTKRRCDPDNMVPKFILDGLVEAGLLKDDDGQTIETLTLKTDYDKDNPRTVIEITVLDEDKGEKENDRHKI